MFTQENTEGFSPEILEKMNDELANAIEDLDIEDFDYGSQVKHIEEQIFNKYC